MTKKTFWFGDPQFIRERLSIRAPVGLICHSCEESISSADCGVVMETVEYATMPEPPPGFDVVIAVHDDDSGQLSVALHVECLFRETVGSVGHLTHRCTCYGGDFDDPPGMTKRQAAAAAYRMGLTLKMGKVAMDKNRCRNAGAN